MTSSNPSCRSSALAILASACIAASAASSSPSHAEPGDLSPIQAPDAGAEDAPANAPEPAPPKLHKEFKGKPYEQAFRDGFPDTPKKRARVLSDLYAHLATSADPAAANEIAGVIERLWMMSGSDTVSVLMERSMQAVAVKKNDVALNLLDAVVRLAPDFAEGWNRRAFVHFLMEERMRAAGDLRRVLALEPNHFKAMQGLAQILNDAGQKKSALKAYRKLIEVHPFAEGAGAAIRELRTEVEGQGI